MKKERTKDSKINKPILALSIVLSLAGIVLTFLPELLEWYWPIKIIGIKVPLIFALNFILLAYWLYKARVLFVIPFISLAIQVAVLISNIGWDAFVSDAEAVIVAKEAGIQDVVIKNYLASNINLPQHPRLLLADGEIQRLKAAVSRNKNWDKINNIIRTNADASLAVDELSTAFNGKKEEFIANPRQLFKRCFFMAYAWRITKNKKYLEGVKQDIITAISMKKWDTGDMLRNAEITIAVALIYDWIYNDLDDAERNNIQLAIATKALQPALNSFYNSRMAEVSEVGQIWNSVMICAALAVYESNTELAKKVINQSIGNLKSVMSIYKTGVHPAGYQFAAHSTIFTIMAIEALRAGVGSDFEISESPGFSDIAQYLNNLISPSGIAVNFGDGDWAREPNAALCWFAEQKKDGSLLWSVNNSIAHGRYEELADNKFLPLSVIWGSKVSATATPPANKVYWGGEKNQLAVMRTSWTDTHALFTVFKLGSASELHNHMDIGSFTVEENGIQWINDIGFEPLHKLEANGINVNDMSQNSSRWRPFRNNSSSHSVLSVGNQDQTVNGFAKLISKSDRESFTFAVANIQPAYQDILSDYKRGIAIVNKKFILVQDELTTITDESLRWKLLVKKGVKFRSDNVAEIKDGVNKFFIKVITPSQIKFQEWSTKASHKFESDNLNKELIGFTIEPQTKQKISIIALFTSDSTLLNKPLTLKSLNDWN